MRKLKIWKRKEEEVTTDQSKREKVTEIRKEKINLVGLEKGLIKMFMRQ